MTRLNLDSAISWIAKLSDQWSLNQDSTGGSSSLKLSTNEINRLKSLPRLTHTVTHVAGCKLRVTDPFWFLYTHDEICLKEIYRFHSKNAAPFILDCGANIGLSVIYFKQLYPKAQIVAFEPDPTVFSALVENIQSFELREVTALQKAVWKSETAVAFEPDGSVGGRIASANSNISRIEVPTVRLHDWLDRPVDMLKLDIEGAEYEVLLDCRGRLQNVDYLFVEYHAKPDEPQQLHELLRILQEADFRYHIQDANPIDHPFVKEERHTYYDLQLNVFAFRD